MNLFGRPPPAPVIQPSPLMPMPNPNDPAAIAARNAALAKANSAGRSSTQLTQAAANTIAGGAYAGDKTGL